MQECIVGNRYSSSIVFYVAATSGHITPSRKLGVQVDFVSNALRKCTLLMRHKAKRQQRKGSMLDITKLTRKEKLKLARAAGYSLHRLKGNELDIALRSVMERIRRFKERTTKEGT
jgi:hypothetical protein